VVLQEMAQRGLIATGASAKHLRGQTLVVVTIPREGWRRLFDLRTVEDVFLVLYDSLPMTSATDLTRIEPGRFKRHLSAAVPFHPVDFRRRVDFAVFVKQDEDRTVYRKQIADVIATTARTVHPGWMLKEPAEVELWAFFAREKLTVGLRLTNIHHRQRTWRGQERPGSLRPTLAASLVALSEARADDVVLDPMCGSGTILIERGLWGPVAELIGGDSDDAAVKIARHNADRAGLTARIGRWDASAPAAFTGLEGRVDRIICNLPFGIQHGKAEALPALYVAALRTWKPLLSGRGAMILLTSRGAELRKAAALAGMEIEAVHRLFLQGIWAEVFALEPR
jgi:23S rRNA G2445 N2-methylase RlmL